MGQVRVGISGWTYPPWRGNFYPDGLPQRLELPYAARRFNALEINGTFYSLQKPSSFASWREQTPPGFVFSLKGGKYITHERRLKDVEGPLANFVSSGLLALGEKLGPILWQFPPNLKFDAELFRTFLGLLPHDVGSLARMARNHDDWMKGKSLTEPQGVAETMAVRHAVEFRNESWVTPEFFSMMREHNVAAVIADAAGKFPVTEEVTADYLYLRLHGAREMYASGYTEEELDSWAGKIRGWMAEGGAAGGGGSGGGGRDVFVFFDNTDVKQRAPVDARGLAERLGVAIEETPEQAMEGLGVKAKKGKVAKAKAGAEDGEVSGKVDTLAKMASRSKAKAAKKKAGTSVADDGAAAVKKKRSRKSQ